MLKVALIALLTTMPSYAFGGIIADVYWPGGELVGNGYSGYPMVEIRNTNNVPHEYWIRISVRDPSKVWHEKLTWFQHTSVIVPNMTDSFNRINIRVSPHEDKMPMGLYTGKVILYDSFEQENILDINVQKDAFEVKT